MALNECADPLPAGLEYVAAPAWDPDAEPLPEPSGLNGPAVAGTRVSKFQFAIVAALVLMANKTTAANKPHVNFEIFFILAMVSLLFSFLPRLLTLR